VTVARLGDHSPYTRADRLHGRPHQAGHEFASGIGREKRKPIRRLVEIGLKGEAEMIAALLAFTAVVLAAGILIVRLAASGMMSCTA
jgi:hypothetical protein